MSILEMTHEKQMKEFAAITEKKVINVNEFEAWKFDCLWAEVVYKG